MNNDSKKAEVIPDRNSAAFNPYVSIYSMVVTIRQLVE
jgi:hypothetical protein